MSKPAPPLAPPPAKEPRRWSSDALFGAATLVQIEHRQQVYVLRQTAQGKLILTK